MKKSEKYTIKVDDSKLAIGHQEHITGTGAHDPRPRKQRTRGGRRRAWKKEYEV